MSITKRKPEPAAAVTARSQKLRLRRKIAALHEKEDFLHSVLRRFYAEEKIVALRWVHASSFYENLRNLMSYENFVSALPSSGIQTKYQDTVEDIEARVVEGWANLDGPEQNDQTAAGLLIRPKWMVVEGKVIYGK